MSQPEMSQPAGQVMAVPAGSQQPIVARQGEWSASFFGCFNDLTSCLVSCFLPCVQYGWNKERIENKDGWAMDCLIYACCSCVAPCLGAGVRGNIRNRSGIEGGFVTDCALHCCCVPCALTQEKQQLDALLGNVHPQ